MKYKLLSLFALMLVAGTAPAAAQVDLEGAWKPVAIWGDTQERGKWSFETAQPGLFLFHDGHYSFMYLDSDKARPLMPAYPTRASIPEKDLRIITEGFVANAGVYSVEGNKLTTRPSIAWWPNFMEGGHNEWTIEGQGDIVTISIQGGARAQKDGTQIPVPEGRSYSIRLKRIR